MQRGRLLFKVKLPPQTRVGGDLRRGGTRPARRPRGAGAAEAEVRQRPQRPGAADRDVSAFVGAAPRAGRQLGPAASDLPPQPRRPGRAALRDRRLARARCRRPACRGSWRCSGATACSPASRRCRSCPSWRRRRCGRWRCCRGARDDPFRDEEPGKILHELRLGEMTAFEDRPALALLRRGRLDAAVPDPARGVRALDRRPRAGARARARGARRDRLDRRVRRPRQGRLRRVRTAQRRRPASTTSAGRTRGTRSRSPTARWRPTPRATCELQGYVYDAKRRDGAPGARGLERSGTGPTSSNARRPSSRRASTATSGSPSAASSRSRSTARSARSTR